MIKICIGIPCFRGVSEDVLQDYMRLMYHVGRRMPQYEFMLAVKGKTEQFRARNAMMEAALQTGCDYLWMVDDDQVFDWEDSSIPNSRYNTPDQLVKHLEADEKMGICGALYWQRGSECNPVIMKRGKDGGMYWMRDDEIQNGLQEVAVTGGGCMMIKLSMMDKIKGPWFEPEFDKGTDIQICDKATEAGFKVCCDTSIQIGHESNRRTVITPINRTQISLDNARKYNGGDMMDEGIDPNWGINSALALYRQDAEEYLGVKIEEMVDIASRYNAMDFDKYRGNLDEYYRMQGNAQLARQVIFHHNDIMISQFKNWLEMVNHGVEAHGIDFGCGSAPIGFELAMRGHTMDLIDIDGTGAYEFLKWRVKKRGIEDRCNFEMTGGPYDYAFFMDSIEHLEDWKGVLSSVVENLKTGGGLITNYFKNHDYNNPEHISMDKSAVTDYLVSKGVYPLNEVLWVKKDLGFMDRGEDEKSAA